MRYGRLFHVSEENNKMLWKQNCFWWSKHFYYYFCAKWNKLKREAKCNQTNFSAHIINNWWMCDVLICPLPAPCWGCPSSRSPPERPPSWSWRKTGKQSPGRGRRCRLTRWLDSDRPVRVWFSLLWIHVVIFFSHKKNWSSVKKGKLQLLHRVEADALWADMELNADPGSQELGLHWLKQSTGHTLCT